MTDSLHPGSFDGFGHPPNVPVGSEFANRKSLAAAKVHRPHQAGICGKADRGAESIVVSGGYEDDEDYGNEIIYTGQGGRAAGSNRHTHDQELKLGNAALVTSISSGTPVRVIRGKGGDKEHSPASGLRYDGLFRVEEYWSDRGQSNFLVWRYRLRAITADTTSADANAATNIARTPPPGTLAPGRASVSTQRIIRSTAVANHVKRIHNYTCQVCDTRLVTPSGAYAEAAHIRPLGRPHDGPDISSNVLCLCPNHHVLFDMGMLTISTDRRIVIHGNPQGNDYLRESPSHLIAEEFLAYHRAHHEGR
ncbi:YDG/SRA domain-containing protein [Streptomyces sp. H39-C1]|uniref:YDG/SRA domain-containing protein n=1 Tax=Streptomyces sp. H39-C1 TaxID=3004355 RepID=UPI0022AF1CF6|nr:YDG/SRA domain-containing protein [Streptomyces sp. H39-C1]MCZ4096017.1 HNH endonuclease [Streptomyces sp. H39-C1]